MTIASHRPPLSSLLFAPVRNADRLQGTRPSRPASSSKAAPLCRTRLFPDAKPKVAYPSACHVSASSAVSSFARVPCSIGSRRSPFSMPSSPSRVVLRSVCQAIPVRVRTRIPFVRCAPFVERFVVRGSGDYTSAAAVVVRPSPFGPEPRAARHMRNLRTRP